jgi:hypothetical protein
VTCSQKTKPTPPQTQSAEGQEVMQMTSTCFYSMKKKKINKVNSAKKVAETSSLMTINQSNECLDFGVSMQALALNNCKRSNLDQYY